MNTTIAKTSLLIETLAEIAKTVGRRELRVALNEQIFGLDGQLPTTDAARMHARDIWTGGWGRDTIIEANGAMRD